MPTTTPDRASAPSRLSGRFDALRTELEHLAIVFERRKRLDAADVALSLHALLEEMRDELTASEAQTVAADAAMEPCAS